MSTYIFVSNVNYFCCTFKHTKDVLQNVYALRIYVYFNHTIGVVIDIRVCMINI